MNTSLHSSCAIELHYLPCIQYLSLFFGFNEVKLERYEHYQKGSYRNRCHIGSAQGREMLSVPLLKGKNQQQLITDVRIAYHTPWYAQHWHAIQTTYGKAAFFPHYADEIHDILYSRFDELYELNMTLLKWFLEKTHAPGKIAETTAYALDLPQPLDYRNTIVPSKEFSHPAYNQVFMDRLGFIQNLSSLDLLMHLGREAYGYLAALSAETL